MPPLALQYPRSSAFAWDAAEGPDEEGRDHDDPDDNDDPDGGNDDNDAPHRRAERQPHAAPPAAFADNGDNVGAPDTWHSVLHSAAVLYLQDQTRTE